MRLALVFVVGLFLLSGGVTAQELAEPIAAAEEAVTEAAAVVESAVDQTAVAVESAQVITLRGRVSVVKEADGTVRAIYINPEMGHGYKVDLQNGEGKTLADKHGKLVEATGVDVNRMFNIQAVAVIE